MSNAPARVTVTYRVQVTTVRIEPNGKPQTKILKRIYKTHSGATRAALRHTQFIDSKGRIAQCFGQVITQTATPPLH